MNNGNSNMRIINDSDGKLDVISSVRNNALSYNCRVIKIKDVPLSLDMGSVRRKTSDVINRVNKMISLVNNDNVLNGVKDNKFKFSLKINKSMINKGMIKDMFGNNKFVVSVLVLTFVFSCFTVGKTFSLKNKLDEYSEYFVEIDKKDSTEATVYLDSKSIHDELKNVAASKLVNCINSSINVDELPNSVTSIIDEINDYYNQSNNYFSFKYKDIYTGFSVSYNEKQNIFTASTIKAPKDIYIYEMASQGKINLDDRLTYTGEYANTGSWNLNKFEFNTEHTIRDLSKYSIVSSDNAAHNMLMDHFGRENMLSFWKKLGTTSIFTENNNWGVINAHDAVIYMDELYKFYLIDEVYGEEIMNNFLNATPKFITGKNNYMVANKGGWAGSSIHDVSIVFADNPYIVVALSNLGNSDNYMQYFNKVNDLTYRLHTEYWKYKMSVCNEIHQY